MNKRVLASLAAAALCAPLLGQPLSTSAVPDIAGDSKTVPGYSLWISSEIANEGRLWQPGSALSWGLLRSEEQLEARQEECISYPPPDFYFPYPGPSDNSLYSFGFDSNALVLGEVAGVRFGLHVETPGTAVLWNESKS